ncbi:alpha-N-acetylglucosaminidase C-terminal domain-containing protein [Salmonella enterica]|uniref:Alpha-N-acetylglucosaminidase n=1 Tax=Salmonella enterica TaxID=28901 RepID=A0A403SZ96_SALER|nr:alpha-N-acetylglucosaminidase C-terminal domain-containing protein [Salmonella enterica]EHQ9197125.1 alpha-N-acetylglucosaminidase C-terminal domain-containing protein [Salmonella enterica subsp. diarizonae serovar 50:k:z:[z50],[z57],[z68], [z86]]EAA0679979.1 alpha-N-acetylglucosaminidase [Salmonella enterica subsp. diarizonae]EAN5457227.1 alpha-N-acetylglucosaminidase [Salmonella enterica]EAZ3044143.1 alpha-N-acetylglucosaminidase [Salmonella enterica]ECC3892764.1 alpha-N-acetylglucosamini
MKKTTGWLSLLALSISLVCHQAAANSRLSASAIRVLDAQGNNVSQPLLDNNPATQWQSKLDYNRWLEMDLKGTYQLSELQLTTPLNTLTRFDVYSSDDGVTYRKIASAKTGKTNDRLPLNVRASRLRINITDYSTGTKGVVNDISLTGDKISDTAPTPPAIRVAVYATTEWAKRHERRQNMTYRQQEVVSEAQALVERVLGAQYQNRFIFTVAPSTTGKDSFTVKATDGKISISGPNGISLASGLNWYLKNYLHVNYDPLNVSNLTIPTTWPMPKGVTEKATPYQYKYALNFCTPSYTMAFWRWHDYEKFLDWAAMNGVNLMLDVVGQEEVQRRMLHQFGYSDNDVRQYLPGPAYFGWFYMANMQSFGGPLPQSWFAQRTELARKIHDRMEVYGITPVFPGFAGQVPDIRHEFSNTPWIWNMLHAFGGRMGFSGMPEVLAQEIPQSLAESKYMKGVGVTAESLGTNPMLYEMLYDMAWEKSPISSTAYIHNWLTSRYGAQSPEIEQAWDIMVKTAYHRRKDRQRAEDSIIDAKPSFGVTRACTYYTALIDYDKAEFEKILPLYLSVYDRFKDNPAYQHDLVDITRQVLANASYEYYRAFEDAWMSKDYSAFNQLSGKFLRLIRLQDKVLGTRPEFMLGTWINSARTMLDGMDDWTRDQFEFNARAMVTTWGTEQAADAGLRDYSNRQWQGLTGDFYYQRWATWIQALKSAAATGQKQDAIKVHWFPLEYRWVNQTGNGYPTQPSGHDIRQLAQQALSEFSVTSEDLRPYRESKDKRNLALNKPVFTHGDIINAEFSTERVVDGQSSTLWGNKTWPADLIIDLQGVQKVDGIELEFEQTAEDMRNPVVSGWTVEIQDAQGNWRTIQDKSKDFSQKQVINAVPYKGEAQKVRVVLTGTDFKLRPDLKPQLAEIRVLAATQ